MEPILNIARKLAPRLVILAVAYLAFGYIYKNLFWKDDLEKYSDVLPVVLELRDSCDVLYFGESSNFSFHPTRDSLEDRISDFTSYYFPNLCFGTVNSSAYHGGIYLPLIEQIGPESRVKTVVVTLNMRTFDQAAIHSELESALQQSKVMYSLRPPFLNRILLTLNYYDNEQPIERDRKMWSEWTFDTLKSENPAIKFEPNTIRRWCEVIKFPDSNGIENMAKRALADHNIKAFAFEITENNPRVKDFDAIVKVCKDNRQNIVLNILAENVEYADSLVGENLVWLMRKNRDFLVNRYASMGAMVVDNLESVGGYHYTDQDWTTEHYDQIGRQIIAKNLADSLRKFYPEN
jgi:hypothetical protein